MQRSPGKSRPDSWVSRTVDAVRERMPSRGGILHEVRVHRAAMRSLLSNPEGVEAYEASRRTAINAVITALDFIPAGIGEVPSLGADALKIAVHTRHFLERWGRRLEKWIPGGIGKSMHGWFDRRAEGIGVADKYNLTPDVSLLWAVPTELIEIPTGGAAPTHGIESLLQLRHDYPRMKRGYTLYRKLLRRERTPKLPPAGGSVAGDVIDIIPDRDT